MNSATTYRTRQKERIMDCLILNKNRHITADEILDELKKEDAKVGKTTVYRYLDKLVSQGTVRKYFIEEGKGACYQYMEENLPCAEHYHLKCLECGKLIHLECDYLGDMDSHIRDRHGFYVDHCKTVLYGHCGNCAGKPKGENK